MGPQWLLVQVYDLHLSVGFEYFYKNESQEREPKYYKTVSWKPMASVMVLVKGG